MNPGVDIGRGNRGCDGSGPTFHWCGLFFQRLLRLFFAIVASGRVYFAGWIFSSGTSPYHFRRLALSTSISSCYDYSRVITPASAARR